MYKKLRIKFVLYGMLSLFALLAVILGAINVTNFILVGTDADAITEQIAQNGGSFMNPGMPPMGGEGGNPMGPGSPETKDSTRYFTVAVENSEATVIDYKINAFTQEEIKSWGISLSKKNLSTGWSRTNYRYRLYSKSSEPTKKYVTVIDQSRELLPSFRVLIASIIGGVGGLGISFVVLFFVSKKLVKPLEDSNYKQKRFISDASHELKTPLAIISANNEILEIKYGQNEEIVAINKEVERLKKIISNLNLLAKLDDIKDENIVRNEFSLSDLGNDIVHSFVSSFQTAKKEFRFEIEENLSYKGDEERIRELLSILIENALKYATSEASFTIKKESERIVIEERNDVKGIEGGPLETVFERFYRSEQARSSGAEGSGIGLSIAKQIVSLHKGRIYARGENGYFIIKVEL